jgi:two-component system, OmpR family, response regulator ChvI
VPSGGSEIPPPGSGDLSEDNVLSGAANPCKNIGETMRRSETQGISEVEQMGPGVAPASQARAGETNRPALSAAARTRVVLVDDNPLFRESLSLNLTESGFDVRAFGSGKAAVAHLVAGSDDDIVLLDWMMPEMNGIEVLSRIRDANIPIPIIFLTELTDQIYEEAALQRGAVDFVDKSRSFSILLRRINLIVQGAKSGRAAAEGDTGTGPVLVRGDLELRRQTARAFWKGSEVALTNTEFKMVDLLATRAGEDIRYRELYDLVHGEGFLTGSGAEGYRANVRAFVKRIRDKFRVVDRDWDVLENYSGFGYRWRDCGDAS